MSWTVVIVAHGRAGVLPVAEGRPANGTGPRMIEVTWDAARACGD
jgi:hypothetical protein